MAPREAILSTLSIYYMSLYRDLRDDFETGFARFELGQELRQY